VAPDAGEAVSVPVGGPVFAEPGRKAVSHPDGYMTMFLSGRETTSCETLVDINVYIEAIYI
jgi:hypothetical protein